MSHTSKGIGQEAKRNAHLGELMLLSYSIQNNADELKVVCERLGRISARMNEIRKEIRKRNAG